MNERAFICRPDDGNVHIEAMVEPDRLVLCLWRCEDTLPDIERSLAELGLAAVLVESGPCVHEGAS